MNKTRFEWDEKKDILNQKKHFISFKLAQKAFLDPKRLIARDLKHSKTEQRFFCFGKVNKDVLTVRFTLRNNKIRIIGAGFWRKGKQTYEKR